MGDVEAAPGAPDLAPALAPGLGRPSLERTSVPAIAMGGPASPSATGARTMGLRRSASFGVRPGSGAGSFGSLHRSSSFLARNPSFADLSNRGARSRDGSSHSFSREPLLPPEE